MLFVDCTDLHYIKIVNQWLTVVNQLYEKTRYLALDMTTVTATCYFVNGTFVQNGGEGTTCQAISNKQNTASMSWKLSMLS